MTTYNLTRTAGTKTRVGWNGEPLRRLAGKMRAFFAPVPHTNEYRGSFDLERGYDYWLDALHASDHPSTYR